IGITMNQNEIGNHVNVSCVDGGAVPNRKSPQAAGVMIILVEIAAVAVKKWIADKNSENRL
uniref:hypothetical protein n=1 Tax=Aeromonas veronii TaxID=654 RepID=UPI003D229790